MEASGDRQLLDPQSALVRAARELLAVHTAADDGGMALCEHCQLLFPCPTVMHARQVCDAGGLGAAGLGAAAQRDAAVAV